MIVCCYPLAFQLPIVENSADDATPAALCARCCWATSHTFSTMKRAACQRWVAVSCTRCATALTGFVQICCVMTVTACTMMLCVMLPTTHGVPAAVPD